MVHELEGITQHREVAIAPPVTPEASALRRYSDTSCLRKDMNRRLYSCSVQVMRYGQVVTIATTCCLATLEGTRLRVPRM